MGIMLGFLGGTKRCSKSNELLSRLWGFRVVEFLDFLSLSDLVKVVSSLPLFGCSSRNLGLGFRV